MKNATNITIVVTAIFIVFLIFQYIDGCDNRNTQKKEIENKENQIRELKNRYSILKRFVADRLKMAEKNNTPEFEIYKRDLEMIENILNLLDEATTTEKIQSINITNLKQELDVHAIKYEIPSIASNNNEDLRKENESLKKTISDLKLEISKKDADILELNIKIKQLTIDKDDLIKKLTIAQNNNNQAEVATLKSQIAKLEFDTKTANEKAIATLEEKKDIEDQNKKLQDMIDNANKYGGIVAFYYPKNKDNKTPKMLTTEHKHSLNEAREIIVQVKLPPTFASSEAFLIFYEITSSGDVTLTGKTYRKTTSSNGETRVNTSSFQAGKKYKIKLLGQDKTVELCTPLEFELKR